MLDAGCGTGAYSRAIIGHVGRIEAVDLSDGMLEVARAKLAIESQDGRIRFHNAPITDLPFEAETIDGVMVNQVTHHLGDTAEDGFTVLRRAVAEFARVLRPGGVLVFNTCSREQIDRGYWYYALIPEAREIVPGALRAAGGAARHLRGRRVRQSGQLRAARRGLPGRCLFRRPGTARGNLAQRGFDLGAGG